MTPAEDRACVLGRLLLERSTLRADRDELRLGPLLDELDALSASLRELEPIDPRGIIFKLMAGV